MEMPSPRGSIDLSRSQDKHPQIGSIAKTTRRLLLAALVIGSALIHGCATQEKANKPQTAKKYVFVNPPEVKVVERQVNFCGSIKDVRAEARRCTRDVLISKENGLHCLKCTRKTEEVNYKN